MRNSSLKQLSIASVKESSATPLDPIRSTRLAERVLHLLAAANFTHPPNQAQVAKALDATWIVASCWKIDFFDQRMTVAEDIDLQHMRDYFDQSEQAKVLPARLSIIRAEYEYYTSTISEALAKALCPKERKDAIIFQLKKNFIRQRAILDAMSKSPLWSDSLIHITMDVGSIAAKSINPRPNPGEPALVHKTTWADRSLLRLPLVLDPAVTPSIAAATLSFDADRLIMSLVDL